MFASNRGRSLEFVCTVVLLAGAALAAVHSVNQMAGNLFDERFNALIVNKDWWPLAIVSLAIKMAAALSVFGLLWIFPRALLLGDMMRDARRQRAAELLKAILIFRAWVQELLSGVSVDHAPLRRPPRAHLT